MDDALLEQAARAIADADALLIGAGAGMGVDSGLPDFRGDKGFWKAYPPYARLGLNFVAVANPQWFQTDPELAWGFYGHRLNLYHQTTPHAGFQILRRWAARMSHGHFVYTSNVDGHFQRSGFAEDRIVEVHGTLRWMQCMQRSCGYLAPVADDRQPVTLDETTMRALPPLPACPQCGGLARPNVLMFGDGGWDESRSWQQEALFNVWRATLRHRRLVVVECGAGEPRCDRLNVREPQVPPGHIGLAMGALAGVQAIDERLGQM